MRTYLKPDLFTARFPLAVILSSLIIILFILSSPHVAYSLDITLAWDMTPGQKIAGFKAFYRKEGQGYDYNNPAWDGNVTTCTIRIDNFKQETPYYFIVRAYSKKGEESDDSNEVRYVSTENLPPFANAGPDKTMDERATILLDGSGSVDPDGNIVSYNWSQLTGTNVKIADPSSALVSFTSLDMGPGEQLLTFELTVTDDGGLQSTDTCEINISYIGNPLVNNPPVAKANGPYSGTEGRAIGFNSKGSGDVNGDNITYNWDFGNGATSTNANPSHTYDQNGTYTITLTVSDGSLTDTDTTTVTVSDRNPIVDFIALPTKGSEPVTVSFIAAATSYDGITLCSWNFGDGYSGTGPRPRHTYTSSGTYTVSLSAIEPDGDMATKTKSRYITVINNPEPIPGSFKPVTDGGNGDSDGTANGIIVDPGGLAQDEFSGSHDNGSPKGGCFVGTIDPGP